MTILREKKDLANPEIFGELYDALAPALLRHACLRVRKKEEAEDLVSAVFEKTWIYLAEGGEIKNPKAFLYQILRNSIIDYFRTRKEEIWLEENNTKIQSERKSLPENLFIQEEAEEIKESLKKIKPEFREIIILRYVDELSFAEIEKILRKKRGTLYVMLHRALKELKQCLESDSFEAINKKK